MTSDLTAYNNNPNKSYIIHLLLSGESADGQKQMGQSRGLKKLKPIPEMGFTY